ARGQWLATTLSLTNYHALVQQADAERQPQTAAAREKLYRAEQLEQQDRKLKALAAFEEALDGCVDILLEFLDFSRQPHVQEETYEAELKSLHLLQERKQTMLEPLVVWTNRMTHGAIWNAGLTNATLALAWQKRAALAPRRFISMRNVYGPLDMLYVYRGTSQ